MTTRDALIGAGIIEPTDTVAQAEVKILGFRALVLAEAAAWLAEVGESNAAYLLRTVDVPRRMTAVGPAGKGIPAGDESTQPTSFDRCPAAYAEDPSPCEGVPDAVTVVDRQGAEALGCVQHAARLYASLDRPRVYPSEGHLGAAVEVYRRAQQLKPFGWMRGDR